MASMVSSAKTDFWTTARIFWTMELDEGLTTAIITGLELGGVLCLASFSRVSRGFM